MDYNFLLEKQAKDLRGSRIKLLIMLVLMALVAAAFLKYGPGQNRVAVVEPERISTAVAADVTAFAEKTLPPPKQSGEIAYFRGQTAKPAEKEAAKADTTKESLPLPTPAVAKPVPEIAAKPEELGESSPIPPAAVLEQVRDGASDIEPLPFFHLLARVDQDKPSDLKAQAKKGLDWKALADRPASLRGEPVEVRGTLVRSWRQPLGKSPLKLPEVWAYRLRAEGAPPESADGLFDVYSIKKLPGALPADRLVAYGRFLKERTAKADRPADPDLRVAVVLAPAFEPLTYLDEPQPPQPIVQDARPELRAIYYFLKRVGSMALSELKSEAAKGFAPDDFTTNAERNVGRPAAIRGELRRCERIDLGDNPLGLTNLYYGYLRSADGTMNTFYCLTIPEGIRVGDPVVLYGLFLKRWTYLSQSDRQITSPVFIGACLDREMAEAILEQIHDKATDIEPGPLFYLLGRVLADKYDEVKAQAKEVPDWNTFWDDPASLRGKPVAVRGTLLRSWRQGLGKNPLGLNELWAYRIRAEGAPRGSKGFIFDVYSLEKLIGALPQDSLVTYGRFFKAQTLAPDRFSDNDPELNAAVVLIRRFEPLTYVDGPKPPEPIVQDGSVEARALYYLLKRVLDMPFQDLRAKAATKLTYFDFAAHPEEHLGRPVALRGQIYRCQRIALPENPLRLTSVYYGQIVDVDHKMNSFYCLHIPDGLRLKDEVTLYGLFFKKWNYPSYVGQEITSPVFVAQWLVKLDFPKDYTGSILIACLILGTGLLLIIAVLRGRSQTAAEAALRSQAEQDRMPKDINEAARRARARAAGRDPGPPTPSQPAPPPSPDPKPNPAGGDAPRS